MKKLAEKLYYQSPVFLQNIAISVLGEKLRRERFNEEGEKMLSLLNKSRFYSIDEIENLQNEMFVKIARHAIENTEYYRNWATTKKITPEDIRSIKDIELFPVIEKSMLRKNYEKFKSNINKKIVKLSTSGTTGTPLTVFTDSDSRSRHYAFFTRLRSQYGVKKSSKRATLFGRALLKPEQSTPPFWRMDYAQKNLLLSSYHLNERNLSYYYKKLASYQPEEIFSYPSSIFYIADYIVKNNLPRLKLKLLMTTAEKLQAGQRETINSAFDCPLVDQYGCTEMAFFCSGEAANLMRFHPEHGIIEIRREDETLTQTGDGQLVATGFINYSMPIIRYAVGDEVSISGRDYTGSQVATSISGRVDDVVYTNTGTPVGRLGPIFKERSGIKYSQIFQYANGNIEIRLVPDDNYVDNDGNEIKAELLKRVGKGATINVILLQEIKKEKNGKSRLVISEKTKNF